MTLDTIQTICHVVASNDRNDKIMSKVINMETIERVETLRLENEDLRKHNAVLRDHIDLLKTTRDRVVKERDYAQGMLDEALNVLRGAR